MTLRYTPIFDPDPTEESSSRSVRLVTQPTPPPPLRLAVSRCRVGRRDPLRGAVDAPADDHLVFCQAPYTSLYAASAGAASDITEELASLLLVSPEQPPSPRFSPLTDPLAYRPRAGAPRDLRPTSLLDFVFYLYDV